MKAVIVARGELDPLDAAWIAEADLVVAADGGAHRLDALGLRPDRLVGDLDSTDPALVERLAAQGTAIDRHPVDKEASDTELAVAAAIEAGATEVVLLGAIGGDRHDHALANVLLLADPSFAGRDIRLVHGTTTMRVLHPGATLELGGTAGDAVTLLPIGGDASGVTTMGLRWPLDGGTLRMGRSRGLSNEITGAPASVRIRTGALLVVETSGKEPEP